MVGAVSSVVVGEEVRVREGDEWVMVVERDNRRVSAGSSGTGSCGWQVLEWSKRVVMGAVMVRGRVKVV